MIVVSLAGAASAQDATYAITIDGDLQDWKDVPPIVLTALARGRATRKALDVPPTIHAYAAWCTKGLLIAADVVDTLERIGFPGHPFAEQVVLHLERQPKRPPEPPEAVDCALICAGAQAADRGGGRRHGRDDQRCAVSYAWYRRAQAALKNDPFFQEYPEWKAAMEQQIKMGVRAEQQ